MRNRLDRAIEKKFRGVTSNELMRRMEAAPDFGYDDEEYELSRRLGAVGLEWMWQGGKVITYKPGDGDAKD